VWQGLVSHIHCKLQCLCTEPSTSSLTCTCCLPRLPSMSCELERCTLSVLCFPLAHQGTKCSYFLIICVGPVSLAHWALEPCPCLYSGSHCLAQLPCLDIQEIELATHLLVLTWCVLFHPVIKLVEALLENCNNLPYLLPLGLIGPQA
jgi:hypothetical protein